MSQEYFVSGGGVSAPYAKNNKKRNGLLLTILALSILVTFLAIFAKNSGNEYTRVVDLYMGYTNNNKPDDSYKLLSDNAKTFYKDKDSWKKYVGEVSDKFPSRCSKMTEQKMTQAGGTYDKSSPKQYYCDFKLGDKVNYRIVFVVVKYADNKVLIDEMRGYSI